MRVVTSVLALLAVLLLASCGEDSKHFKIEGHLLKMNQGEFYIYALDGTTVQGIDTIKVQGGRFAYETPCEHMATLSLVFPNFSEIPIYAEPGKTVKISGDASHLKELEIKGTKTNELMSSFREQTASASPPEIRSAATRFIEDHPESVIGTWLVRKYFLAVPTPYFKEAQRLISLMMAKQKSNGALMALLRAIDAQQKCTVGSRLPNFTVYDLDGKPVSSSDLSSGTAVICVWASWSYSSQDMLRQLTNDVQGGKRFKVVAISVDAGKSDCDSYLRLNPMPWPIVCTGDMLDTPLLVQLGMQTVPDNMVVKDGRIVARDLSTQDLADKLK